MKSILFKVLAVTIILCMFVPVLAACGKKNTGRDTLVVGYSTFSQKFSPFFAKTGYDQDVVDMTQVALLTTDREGDVVLKGKTGENRTFNGKSYKYVGIADCTVTQKSDGTVEYKFELRNDIKFSDGKPLTADDVIFSMYVFSDPSYDGASTFYTLPIKGMTEYRTGVKSDIYEKYAAIADAIIEAGVGTVSTEEGVTEALTNAFWTAAIKEAGLKFAQEIVDYCVSKVGGDLPKVNNSENALGMFKWGFGTPSEDGKKITGNITGTEYNCADVTLTDLWNEIVAAYTEDDVVDYEELSSAETAGSDLFELAKDIFISSEGPKDPAAGGVINSIEGIKKTGSHSVTVTMTKFDAAAIYRLAISVAPLHYYGDPANYDYDNNKFGFTKGDLSVAKSKIKTPVGAGAYKFVKFENGVVNFESNENYFKGQPKLKYIKFQEIANEDDKVTALVSGQIDIADPSVSDAVIEAIKKANSKGVLSGDVITYNAVDNLGYGYLGINADNVKVGTNKASEESKALRKAFATLFSVYRDTEIKSYYGDRATVIQYPISNTSWAAPRPADNDFEIAYSKDANGNPIYTDGMTAEQRYEAALTAAISFFKKAGYTFDETTKKFTAAPEGAKMTYEVIIPADGKGDHPSYGILTSTKNALSKIGITLTINDPSDSNVLWNSLDAGTCAMWAAAWGATVDPDMYQVYHSSNRVGLGGTDSNHYSIEDEELDNLIMEARTSDDKPFRKATYKECLDIILDWGVEIPTYQRQNCVLFSTKRVNLKTVTPDITTFWGWMNDIELLEMK